MSRDTVLGLKIILWVANLLFGLALASMLMWYPFSVGMRFDPPGLAVIVGAIFLLYESVLVVHEGGHLLAAVLVGLRVERCTVGLLEFVRTARGFRPAFNLALLQPAAYVMAVPTDARALRGRWAVYVGAGPLASLAAGIGCFVLGARCNEPAAPAPFGWPAAWEHSPLLHPATLATAWFNLAGVVNLLACVGSLYPGRAAACQTDGAQLLALLQGGGETGRLLRKLPLLSALVRDVPPGDWDAAAVEDLLAQPGASGDLDANVLGYYHALATGQEGWAAELLDRVLVLQKGYPADFRATFHIEAALIEATVRHNAAAARARLEKGRCGRVAEGRRTQAEIAVLLAEGRAAAAAAKAEARLAALASAADADAVDAEREWLNEARAEARQQETAAGVRQQTDP